MSDGNWLFNERYDQATKEVPFNELWRDDGGRFAFAVESEFMPSLGVGELGKSITNEEQPRRILFVGTALGPAVVYEKPGPFKDLAMNLSQGIRDTFLFRSHEELLRRKFNKVWNEVSFSELELLLGDPFNDEHPDVNLGHVIDKIQSSALQMTRSPTPAIPIVVPA